MQFLAFIEPHRRWGSVSLDFTFALPKTPEEHTGILVFVDRLSKMAHFVPCTETITGAETAKLYLQHVFKHHGMCYELVSDRDPRFSGAFWQTFWCSLGTKLMMSTARNPQTDGQTERMMRTLKEMLRSYVNDRRDNWAKMLPFVEFAYNDPVQASTGHTPFFLNCGEHPQRPTSILSQHPAATRAPAALDFLAEVRDAIPQARENIKSAQQAQRKAANRTRRDATFVVGDKVLINTEDVKLPTGRAGTLDPKFEGHYEVSQIVNLLTARLRIPNGKKFHDSFHLSKLKAFNAGSGSMFPTRAPRPPPLLRDAKEDLWEVERCIRKQMRRGAPHVLVRWRDYPPADDSWLPSAV